MKPYVFFISLKQEIEPSLFNFLLTFVRRDKKKRILAQRKKQNADTMLAGELLAMYALQKVYGIPMSEQKISCEESGKPFLVNDRQIYFNITHSRNCIAVAVCRVRVGIDLQYIVPYRYATARRFCSTEQLSRLQESSRQDAEFTKLWTQKEAVVKMTGEGLAGMKRCSLAEYSCYSAQIEDYYFSVVWDENKDKAVTQKI